MSFLYPRTISVYRDAEPLTAGLQSYMAPNQSQLVAAGIAASIQLKKQVSTQPADLPADISRRTYWNIIFRAPLGTVLDNDTIVDDLGVRYQVTAAYWNSLGYNCLCERMEA